MGRGTLTDEVKELSKELFSYEISQTELRLMPYIQYTMVNSQKLDVNRINSEERKILSKWRRSGHITGGASDMTIIKDFWDKMNEILWVAYVNYE